MNQEIKDVANYLKPHGFFIDVLYFIIGNVIIFSLLFLNLLPSNLVYLLFKDSPFQPFLVTIFYISISYSIGRLASAFGSQISRFVISLDALVRLGPGTLVRLRNYYVKNKEFAIITTRQSEITICDEFEYISNNIILQTHRDRLNYHYIFLDGLLFIIGFYSIFYPLYLLPIFLLILLDSISTNRSLNLLSIRTEHKILNTKKNNLINI
ncbi:MAG: hypothetical protein A3J93_00410 [Candidatus Magasanikbacteria bacterium RIFOXYC2_FULL_42_28]|uniref:Uncharacterized protein n=1 Tax=Candidatus Magasanikbacteria bacterium RIFOXYC2_FULL_42_28 TaxID=1798704 RepID=A0A1F6NWK4_9BACT|nr:MAG: hypothetical protein A3J93_00410 [Candidatus Magasanikbacteria bacterium RIFOXYC2_FULL_42_28]